ncbi:MAG: transposase [Bryobacterales bacterium]|nr:transposase [Bryobacterales bacterium]
MTFGNRPPGDSVALLVEQLPAHSSLLVSIPPQVTISRLLQWLKGKTAHHLLAEFPHLKKQF